MHARPRHPALTSLGTAVTLLVQGLNAHAAPTDGAAQSPAARPIRVAQVDARRDIARSEPLLLDISVNERPVGGVTLAERLTDGRLALPASVWIEARLLPPAETVTLTDGTIAHPLEAAPGIRYTLDRARLLLQITAPAEAFSGTVLRVDGRTPTPATPPGVGAYINYDLSASRVSTGGSVNQGGLFEAVAFGPRGALVSSVLLRDNGSMREAVRTETYWKTDLPDRMESLVIGDTTGSGGIWSRPVRYGGIRFGRDFGLAPGYITYPIPSIGGAAALPSSVDVLINNRRQGTTRVESGPFSLTNVPITTGSGQMQLVVRDLLGRETVVTQSYYVAPQLLAAGLSDYALEAGALRANYGTRSNDYGGGFVAGTWRRGLTGSLTAEVRTEVQQDRRAAGAGLFAVLGDLGVMTLAGARAGTTTEQGGRWLASVQRTGPGGGASLSYARADQHYTDFGASPDAIRQKEQLTATAGTVVGAGVTLGMMYARQTPWSGTRFSLIGINVGVPLGGNVFLGASLNRTLDNGGGWGGWGGAVSLTIPIDGRSAVAASSTRSAAGQSVDTVQWSQSVPAGPGWGWQLAASDDDNQRLRARALRNGEHGQATAEISAGDRSTAVRVGLSGSLGWMPGVRFASRRIDQGAFVLVRAGDVPGIPVSLSNRRVAVTDESGNAIVTGLLPYQSNTITLEPESIPFGIEISGTRRQVVPYARSGSVVDFPVRKARAALLVLRRADGSPVPAGARILLKPAGLSFTVARRGEAWLTDLQDRNSIRVRWAGGSCDIPLPGPRPVDDDQMPRIGPLTCDDDRARDRDRR